MASFIPTSQVRETATKQHEVTFSALQVVREVRSSSQEWRGE